MEEAKAIIKKLEPHKLATVKIKPEARNADTIWSSKFGGKPYWPKDKAYPKNHDGENLYLLAQINFDEVPALEHYPHTGIVQFFIGNDDLYGMDFDKPVEELISSPAGYRVIFHPHVSTTLSDLEQDLPEADKDSELPLTREYALSFTLDEELPSPTDHRYEKIAGDIFEYDDDVADYIYDTYTAAGSKLGGYANFTQDDPRRGNDSTQWLLLFQLDSEWEDGVEIMWGDMGVANFFIREADLINNDYSKVWYNWDCS